jgi:hypothetical protein
MSKLCVRFIHYEQVYTKSKVKSLVERMTLEVAHRTERGILIMKRIFERKKNISFHSVESESLNPDRLLHSLQIIPLSHSEAKNLLVHNHYLHSFPGGTKLTFGVFVHCQLKGALTFGVGPFLGYKIVKNANPDDAITLTRMWVSNELPHNSESRVLGMVLRSLKKDTSLKFVLTYTDPAAGHLGTIYQASNWLYTGLSSATPLYDIGDGKLHHSRTLAHQLGTHSIRYLTSNGVNVRLVQQLAKHRYIYFLDESWRSRLTLPILPYPKKEQNADENR